MLTLLGFNTLGISSKIELPNIAKLMKQPFMHRVTADEAYKHGGEVIRYLIDKTPLKHNRKYVSVECRFQYLDPSLNTAPRLIWHVDTSSFDESKTDIAHLLVTDCTALTEFVNRDITLEQFDVTSYTGDVAVYMNRMYQVLEGKKIEPYKFVTFDGRHFHRAIRPTEEEFRFTFRVVESDLITGVSFNEGHKTRTKIYRDDIPLGQCERDAISAEGIKRVPAFDNVVQYNDRIVIHTKY